MKSSVKLSPTRWDALVAAVIVLLAAACGAGYWLRLQAADAETLTAVVTIDGTEADRVSLSGLSGSEDRSYTSNGYTLTVEFSPDGVRVKTSNCPTQDCVHTGTITGAGQSIVCLPARISIQLVGTSGSDGVDVVIG